jgi:hypothetical protein
MLVPSYALSRRSTLLAGLLLIVAWLAIYTLTASPTVNFIDSGELITALHEPGVVHPPGYPLYTLLGYVASLLPFGEVAHSVNLFSAFFGALAVGIMFWLVITGGSYLELAYKRRAIRDAPRRVASKKSQPRVQEVVQQAPQTYGLTLVLSALGAGCMLGAASTFWNRSVQAKMYTLHYFFFLLLFWLALSARWSYERGDRAATNRYLVLLAVALGLSFTNHLMTSLTVPGLAVLLLAARDWPQRLQAITRRLAVLAPAFFAPLLLYLYLPLRSAQGPVMDWGAPTTLPDFWRHISGWQYRAYLTNDIGGSATRLTEYATQQWAWLTLLVLALCIASAILLARAHVPLFAATLLTALVTVFFALQYGISEIEPYLVPVYEVFIIWLGLAPPLLERELARPQMGRQTRSEVETSRSFGLPAAALVLFLALVSAVLQFPRQNHSNDHLAEMFAANILNGLEPNSIIITDHWDFQSPSYYLQLVRHVRPDVTVIDKSLLRYPWYLGQLSRRYPWLIENSRDIVDVFSSEQRKWVNDEPFDVGRLNGAYLGLLTSFVERNIDKHPAYVFFSSQCVPSLGQQGEEGNDIARDYTRQIAGLAFRLWPKGTPANATPPDPKFDLRGYTYDKTPLDEFALINARCYANAYALAAQANAGAGNSQKADELARKANEMQGIASGQQ